MFIKLEENPVSPEYWSAADVVQAINEGYDEISENSEWYEHTEAISLTTDKTIALSAVLARPFLYARRILNDQTREFLEPESWRRLDAEYREWDRVTGTPDRFILHGLDVLKLYPRPASAGGTITAHVAAIPVALSDDEDVPGFPEEFHQGLIDYACYDLLCQEKEFKKAMRYWRSFVEFSEGLKLYVQHRLSIGRMGMLGGAF